MRPTSTYKSMSISIRGSFSGLLLPIHYLFESALYTLIRPYTSIHPMPDIHFDLMPESVGVLDHSEPDDIKEPDIYRRLLLNTNDTVISSAHQKPNEQWKT